MKKLNDKSIENGISIVMPTYNQACFIRNAIRSVFSQTYTKWELIIINDGSTDNTEIFIKDYLSDSRITYIRNSENMGIGYSINIALELAKYNYIAYLPSDDFYFANHLETLLSEYKKNLDVVFVTTGIKCEIKDSLMCNRINTITGLPEKYWTQLVQTSHRRTEDRWPERNEWITEDFYTMF